MPSSMFGSGDEDSSSGEGSDVEDASALGIWGPAVPSSTVPTTGALSASHPSIAASASGTQLNSGNYFHFGTNKAGMAGVDRERVNAIIHEASRGSKYYEKAQRNDAKLQERAEALRTRSEHLSDEELQFANVHVERRLAELEAQRDLSRVWAVVDFDAFFAAVEERDFPELKGKPVAIGPLLISTTNYEARKVSAEGWGADIRSVPVRRAERDARVHRQKAVSAVAGAAAALRCVPKGGRAGAPGVCQVRRQLLLLLARRGCAWLWTAAMAGGGLTHAPAGTVPRPHGASRGPEPVHGARPGARRPRGAMFVRAEPRWLD
jgi:hypothetical protein